MGEVDGLKGGEQEVFNVPRELLPDQDHHLLSSPLAGED